MTTLNMQDIEDITVNVEPPVFTEDHAANYTLLIGSANYCLVAVTPAEAIKHEVKTSIDYFKVGEVDGICYYTPNDESWGSIIAIDYANGLAAHTGFYDMDDINAPDSDYKMVMHENKLVCAFELPESDTDKVNRLYTHFNTNFIGNFHNLLWQVLVNEVTKDRVVALMIRPINRREIALANESGGWNPTSVHLKTNVPPESAKEIIEILNIELFDLDAEQAQRIVAKSFSRS